MRRICFALTLTACTLAGCGEDEAPTTAAPATSAPSAEAPPQAMPERTDAVIAAERLRELASTTTDVAFLDDWMDPSQAAMARVAGPALMMYARHAELVTAAREKFGDDGAAAAAQAATAITVELGNGMVEMFEADHFEEVRRDGGRAYVMSNLADMQPIGDPIVFKDNQGDWLLLLCDGDEPWPESRIGMYSSTLSESLKNVGARAAKLDELIDRVRSGSVSSVEQLRDEVAGLEKPS